MAAALSVIYLTIDEHPESAIARSSRSVVVCSDSRGCLIALSVRRVGRDAVYDAHRLYFARPDRFRRSRHGPARHESTCVLVHRLRNSAMLTVASADLIHRMAAESLAVWTSVTPFSSARLGTVASGRSSLLEVTDVALPLRWTMIRTRLRCTWDCQRRDIRYAGCRTFRVRWKPRGWREAEADGRGEPVGVVRAEMRRMAPHYSSAVLIVSAGASCWPMTALERVNRRASSLIAYGT